MRKKYKIAVFSDLKESIGNTLKSALSLGNMLNGEIAIFHVKKATDVVTEPSQLSAIRALNSEYIGMDKDINSIVTTFSKDFGVPLTYSCTIGNLKHEIVSYIEKEKPDFIVLGKRKSKLFNIFGDNLISFILKKHSGPIFLTNGQNFLNVENDLSLGLLRHAEESSISKLTQDLLLHSKKPLKTFKILTQTENLVKTEISKTKKEVEFVFESNDSSLKNLSNYITINKINLLCIKREKSFSITSNIKEIINNLNVPVILMGQPNHTL